MSRASATAGPRILVAGLYHETNTFLPDATPLADFEERAGAALLAAEGDGSPLGCALEEARARGWDVMPAVDLRATPSGTVEDAVVARFRAGLAAIAAEATPVDGVLLILHGAMVSESLADVEGEVLRHLRALPGLADVPVVAVLDLPANVTDAMGDLADALVIYRETPHTDAGETGRRAARLLDRLARSGERMATLCARPPVVWPPTGTATAADPMRALE
ncbi:MAG TPA: M81 family metallopeptidase, partial [Armatimonadaceae bacterium]|nr:M81 family metallopeptidase [Armatimonadaceae bacterium]